MVVSVVHFYVNIVFKKKAGGTLAYQSFVKVFMKEKPKVRAEY